MGRFLLDSDVIIWHLRGHDVVTNMLKDLQKMGVPACSSLSVVEVKSGMRAGEEEMTESFFDSLQVYAVDRAVADEASRLIRQYKKKGVTVDIPDAVIAATCMVNEMVLVTYNTEHYTLPEMKFYSCPSLEER